MTSKPAQAATNPALCQFPRTSDIPKQSPKYWAKEKDRYIRQLLIQDIEASTGRPLFVYFSQLDQEINHTDPDDLSEILQGINSRTADFFIQTPGGNVDATEKIISVLRKALDEYRVVVPSWAKSAGTVIALSSSKILFGINSELGPIDPQWKLQSGLVPCEILATDPTIPPHLREMASNAVKRTRAMTKQVLSRGMLKGKTDQEIDDILAKISSTTGYLSHGAVIDYSEAGQLGLNVEFLDANDELWKRIWLLYCLYDFDTKAHGFGKILEGARYSISRPKPRAVPTNV